ncbi:MAG: hypothetical protein M3466_14110 [Gemmatimonadota bacterium]|nr:hypothetical protein [Gemmatimonadota bacterium]
MKLNLTVRTRLAAQLVSAALVLACTDPVSPPGGRDARPILFIGRPDMVGGNSGEPVIYAVRGDGSGLRVLATASGQALYPAWSRDGARVAFTSGDDLWIMNGDGSDPRRASIGFPSCAYGYRDITWAPTGDRLAAECLFNTSVFNLTSGASYSLSTLLGTGIWRADWSPDGTRLAFSDPFGPDVSEVGVDGTGLRLLLAEASEPAWSSDGRQLAFVSSDGGRQSIYIANIDGSNRRSVTAPDSISADEGPTWSPDGRWLAFHRRSVLCAIVGKPPERTCIPHWSLYVVRLDGTGLRRLTPDSLQATRPSW